MWTLVFIDTFLREMISIQPAKLGLTSDDMDASKRYAIIFFKKYSFVQNSSYPSKTIKVNRKMPFQREPS